MRVLASWPGSGQARVRCGGHEGRTIATLTQRLDRERLLGRLASPEGDEGLLAALDVLRRNHYSLWKILDELYLGDRADPSKLTKWERCRDPGDPRWWKARSHEDALMVLALGLRGR